MSDEYMRIFMFIARFPGRDPNRVYGIGMDEDYFIYTTEL